MSVQVSYSKQFLSGFIFILIFLGVVEGLARIYEEIKPQCGFIESQVYEDLDYETKRKICEEHNLIYYSNDPLTGLITMTPNQHSQTVNINDDGFRGTEISKEKSDGIFRLFVVGGSTTFGSGSSFDETSMSGFLQQKFEQMNLQKEIEIINAGVPSFRSSHELILVQNKIFDYDPDMIIGYDGSNDINNPYNSDIGKERLPFQVANFFAEYAPFYRTIFTIYSIGNEVNYNLKKNTFDETHIQEKVALWKSNWKNICDSSKQKDVDAIIFLQPIVGTGTKKLTNDEQRFFEEKAHDKVIPLYQLFANELVELKESCTLAKDLRNLFDNSSKSIYYDYAHVGDQGNELIAEKIFEIILPIVEQKVSQ